MIPKLSNLEDKREWMDLQALQQYASVCDRTLREWIHLPVGPLPASQVAGGKILVKRAKFDGWLEAHPYQTTNSIDVDQITNQILNEIRKAA